MKHISKISIVNAIIIILVSITACNQSESKSSEQQTATKTNNDTKAIKQENTVDTDKRVQQAKSFANIYSTTCMQYLNELDKLREKLSALPSLPKEKAKLFLNNMQDGLAYPVPDKYGKFVLALPANKNMCAVYAKKANIKTVQQQFHSTFSQAPKPLLVKKNQQNISPQQTIISYEWYQQGAKRKMLFMLSTNSADNASIQALFTASIVQ